MRNIFPDGSKLLLTNKQGVFVTIFIVSKSVSNNLETIQYSREEDKKIIVQIDTDGGTDFELGVESEKAWTPVDILQVNSSEILLQPNNFEDEFVGSQVRIQYVSECNKYSIIGKIAYACSNTNEMIIIPDFYQWGINSLFLANLRQISIQDNQWQVEGDFFPDHEDMKVFLKVH